MVSPVKACVCRFVRGIVGAAQLMGHVGIPCLAHFLFFFFGLSFETADARGGAETGPTLSGDDVGHAGVILRNVIADVADV